MTNLATRAIRYLTVLGALAFLAAVAVTMVDVIGRIIGVTLVRGAIDIVAIAMTFAGALAVAQAERCRLNIIIEPLTGWLPGFARRALDRFWHLAAALLFGFVAVRTLQESLVSHGYGEVITSLGISVAIYGVIIAVGFAVGALAALGMAFHRPDADDDASFGPKPG